MRKLLLLFSLLTALLLAACTNETEDTTSQPGEQQDSSSNETDNNEDETTSPNEEHNDTNTTTDKIPPAALLIENASKLAEKQDAFTGLVSFTQTDANDEFERYDTYYEITDLQETFKDGTIWPEFYRSYIQQTSPTSGEQFETYFSFGKSYFTYRDGEWHGNSMDEIFDMGMHFRLNYFSPYAWLNYLGPFLESIAPYEAYQTDYIVEADINEPELQQFFEENMYMLTEENSIYHYNEWTFVDKPMHIYFIFDKESHRLMEVGTSVKLLNEEYGEYSFDYTQQFDAHDIPSIALPTEIKEATGVSVW